MKKTKLLILAVLVSSTTYGIYWLFRTQTYVAVKGESADTLSIVDDGMNSSGEMAENLRQEQVSSAHQSNVTVAKKKEVLEQSDARKFNPKHRTPSSFRDYFSQDEVAIEERSYLVSYELRSIAGEVYDLSMGREVTRQNGHVFFEAESQNFGQPALFNVRNKSLALLTGRILLKNVSQEQALQLAADYGSVLDRSMEHLGLYAIEIGAPVIQASQELGVSAELEMVEGRVHEK